LPFCLFLLYIARGGYQPNFRICQIRRATGKILAINYQNRITIFVVKHGLFVVVIVWLCRNVHKPLSLTVMWIQATEKYEGNAGLSSGGNEASQNQG